MKTEINDGKIKRTAAMKRSFFLSAFFFTVSGILSAMPSINKEGVVPFTRIGHDILVKARIDSSEKEYNFIIDTGGLTFLDKAVAQELGLKQRGPMAKITTLDLSGYHIEKIFCFTTFDFSILRRLVTPIHGIIGSNLLERFTVTFDFQESNVIFSSDTSSLIPPADGLLFHFHNHPVNNAPLIKFKINQEIVEGMIDTGQPFPVVLPLEDFKKYGKSMDTLPIRSKGLMVKWPYTDPQYNYMARLKSCEFEELRISHVICIFAVLPPMLNMPLIGTDLLSKFRMIINYHKDELLLIPNTAVKFDGSMLSFGLNLGVSEENEVFVEGIWENSPADRMKIHVGDRIIAFNSRKMSPENLSELMDMMEDNSVKTILLDIKDQSGTRQIPLEKAILL